MCGPRARKRRRASGRRLDLCGDGTVDRLVTLPNVDVVAHSNAIAEAFNGMERMIALSSFSPLDIHEWFDPLIRRWLPTLALPGLLPAILLLASLSGLVGVTMRGRLGVAAWRIGVWTFAVLLPTAAVWTVPAYQEGETVDLRACTVGVWLHPSMLASGVPGEVAINVALLVPAGASAWLWRDRTRRLAALLTAFAAPVFLETVQYMLPALHRACQFADMANNALGVWVGFCFLAGVVATRPTEGPGK